MKENNLILNPEGSLLAYRTTRNTVMVRDTAALREVSRITTASGSPEQDLVYNYAFDHTGNLITTVDGQVRQWDPRTGGQLAHYDATALVPAPIPGDASTVGVGVYPAPNQVTVIVRGHSPVSVVELTTGRVTATVPIGPDVVSAKFDPSGQGGVSYGFMGRSRDSSIVLVARVGGLGGPLPLDPGHWQRELCRVIGKRAFTAEAQAARPVRLPAQPVCPATGR
ncbi:hypothetical protein GCM10010452_70780 [Crossiella cryophila]|uniref:hypothetical protein n=1 Tax=Crossiella cryophila TaxID=43355 RepID=UPI0031E7702D